MKARKYKDIAMLLKTGREIEFSYNQKNYSITNHCGFWQVCCDSDNIILEKVCRFEELELLASKIADIRIDGVKIATIFDDLLYDISSLCIL